VSIRGADSPSAIRFTPIAGPWPERGVAEDPEAKVAARGENWFVRSDGDGVVAA
jgi:hypothetical protein